jgi:PAS domain S-box-containing protein
MPNVQNCAVCIYGEKPFGGMDADCCKTCPRPDLGPDQNGQNVCSLKNSEQMISFPLSTEHLCFGQVVIAPDHPEKFESYRPFISNFVNFVAIVLENQRNVRLLTSANEQLSKHKSILEDQVAARTSELTTADQRYQQLVEGTENFVTRVDSEGRFLYVNQASEKIFGLKPEECIGLIAFDFIHPDDRERTKQAFAGWIHDKTENTVIENRQVSRTGEVRDVLWTCHLIFDESGQVIRIDAIARDITERKRAEDEREKLLRSLAAKNEELHSIVYIASHDLKSPLVNIQGFSKILDENCKQVLGILKDLDLGDEVMQQILPLTDGGIHESLKFISASTSKMKALLDGLLQVSRIGSQEINIKTLDMNRLIQSVIDTFTFRINEAGVEVTIDSLPGCLGDAGQINQVFSNIIDNALKYLAPERKGSIKIIGEARDKEIVYCVEDNGIGIHPNHQSKVFELFHRLNPHDSTGGQGLGLTIIKRALSRNDGWTWIESEPGIGSKFFVSLPRGEDL